MASSESESSEGIFDYTVDGQHTPSFPSFLGDLTLWSLPSSMPVLPSMAWFESFAYMPPMSVNVPYTSPSQLGPVSAVPNQVALKLPPPPATAHSHVQAQVPNNHLQDVTWPASASAGSPAATFHGYRSLPNAVDGEMDQWLTLCQVATKRAHKCMWPACLAEPFKNRHSARMHVKEHLGVTKRFECITCDKTFTCRGNAKRHQDTQVRAFSCSAWCFARKDYRKVHQERCAARTPN